MEGVRWTNEDDEEEDFLESSKAENESIWEAPEEAEEEPSWFESQQESRAEDFLSIVRGEKEDEEAEQPGESFMGKLIGEKPEDIQEEEGEALEAAVMPEQTPEAGQEEIPGEPEDLPIDDLEQPSTESLEPEVAEDEVPPEIIEEEPIDQPEEAESIVAHAQETEEDYASSEYLNDDTQDQEPQTEDELPIGEGEEVLDEPEESQPEQYQEEEPIDQLEEIEPVVPQAQEAEEDTPATEEEPNSYEDNDPSDNPEESNQDDGGEEPPEEPPGEPPTEPESNSNDPENPNPNNHQIAPENINVTHEHNAAGAGIVGVLLGAEHFGRKRADRKLRKEIDKNKKAGEESVEEFEDRMKILEEEQRVQAEEQEKLNKLSSENNNQIYELEQDREKPKAAEVQSVSGENFELEEEESEGRERKAGQKLETSIEDSVEEVKFKNQEIGGELALDSRHESSSQKDDGSAADSMVYSASSPSHISDVISNNEIAKAESFKAPENIAGSDNQKEEQRFDHMHESYMSSVQAGVVIGLVIVVFVAILFFFG